MNQFLNTFVRAMRLKTMRFSKDRKKFYGFGSVGAGCNDIPVWRLGVHLFKNGGNMIFRVCYYKNKYKIKYFQYEWEVEERCDCNG